MGDAEYRAAVREKALLCVKVVLILEDLWGGPKIPNDLVEDLALDLMHSENEHFLEDVFDRLSEFRGLTHAEIRFRLRSRPIPESVPSFWDRLDQVHLNLGPDVVGP